MNILSIDPGVERTGFAIFELTGPRVFRFVDCGLIKTGKNTPLQERIQSIYNSLLQIIKCHRPERLIMERLFFASNQKTAIMVAQAQGAMLLLAAQQSMPVTFLTPLQIKEIVTGDGQADKKTVQKMLALELLKGKKIVQDDTADAVACGFAYCITGEPIR